LARARSGSDAEATRRAERAAEVARIYRFYQSHLEREGLLDFGDLIFRTVRLLLEEDAVRNEIRALYQHVLVDEYQDVNRACGVLLGLLANRGEGLWVVGDTRQAIYRWRGAAPAQVQHFLKDFPHGRTKALTINYRSLPPIVRLISAVASQMSALPATDSRTETAVIPERADFSAWHAHRQESNTTSDEQSAVRFEIATDADAEAHGLARLIKSEKERGVPFRAQAVICRKHSQLARFARALEAEDVPTLYLGDLFERSEVRDLLSLVALACDGSGRTLPRVARFSEFRIPLREVRAILRAAKETGREFPDALISSTTTQAGDASARDRVREGATETEDETSVENKESNTGNEGEEGLARLTYHLSRVAHVQSAWKMLAHYLLIHSRYLAPLLADNSSAGAQRRLAIYQLLQFVHSEEARALEATGETEETGEAGEARKDTHWEEEECLFFVALSRARDSLFLSRAERYGNSNSKASELLENIAEHLPRAPSGPATWHVESDQDIRQVLTTPSPRASVTKP